MLRNLGIIKILCSGVIFCPIILSPLQCPTTEFPLYFIFPIYKSLYKSQKIVTIANCCSGSMNSIVTSYFWIYFRNLNIPKQLRQSYQYRQSSPNIKNHLGYNPGLLSWRFVRTELEVSSLALCICPKILLPFVGKRQHIIGGTWLTVRLFSSITCNGQYQAIQWNTRNPKAGFSNFAFPKEHGL